MRNYLDLLNRIIQDGETRHDRTGVGTRSLFGEKLSFDLSKGFPAVTTKQLAWKPVVGELLWFLEGSTDERRLAELTWSADREHLVDKKTIWTANAEDFANRGLVYHDSTRRDLGKIYGAQWRSFSSPANSAHSVDQILNVIHSIKNDPMSRRHIVTAWNPLVLDYIALPACHSMFQFYVSNDDESLSCQVYQRSSDGILGLPFNIASYALLTHLIANECNLNVGKLHIAIGDAHVYLDHIPGAVHQIIRDTYPLPELEIDYDGFDLMNRLQNGFRLDDVNRFTLKNYQHHHKLDFSMAV